MTPLIILLMFLAGVLVGGLTVTFIVWKYIIKPFLDGMGWR